MPNQPKPTRAEVLAAIQDLYQKAHDCGHTGQSTAKAECSLARRNLLSVIERLTVDAQVNPIAMRKERASNAGIELIDGVRGVLAYLYSLEDRIRGLEVQRLTAPEPGAGEER